MDGNSSGAATLQIAPIITFNGLDRSQAMETHILDKVAELEKIFTRIVSCRVTISQSVRRGAQGQLFDVHLELTLPGQDIWVSRDAGQNHAHEDAYVAIRDTFGAARRMLESRLGKRHDHRTVESAPILTGVVDRLFSEDGYGFILSEDDEDVYFNRDALTKLNWDELFVQLPVRFKQYEGEKGLYAVNVTTVDQ